MGQENREDYDEINLYEIWKIILKRKVLIIGFFLMSVLLSAIYSFLSPTIYRGHAVFNILLGKDVMTSKDVSDFLGIVDREKRERILPKTSSSVKSVNIAAIKNSDNKIIVTIDSKKVDDIPLAVTEVQNYLNNIYIIKQNTERKKEVLLKQSTELQELIKSAPNLLVTYRKLFEAGRLSTMGFNPIEVNQSVIGIKVELLKVEQEVSKLNRGGIEMAMQTYVSSKPVGPKVLRNIAIAGILSLLLGMCLAFLAEYLGNIKHR